MITQYDARSAAVYGRAQTSVAAKLSAGYLSEKLIERLGTAGRLTESLQTLAEEMDRTVLWVIEAITLFTMGALSVLACAVHDWQPFLAIVAIIGYCTLAASVGACLISLKDRVATKR